jgi:hypothetical protein
MQYNSIKNAIPKEWREKLKSMSVDTEAINANETLCVMINKQNTQINLISNKDIYWKLVKEIQISHVTKYKWENELGIDPDSWSYYFQIPKLIRDTKIRSFQYKLILKLTPCNLYLNRIGKANSDICNYCQDIDNLVHYIYSCENTKRFWSSFQNWWNQMEKTNIEINGLIAVMGVRSKSDKFNKLNACIQMARWHIYVEKLNLHEPSLYKFLITLKYKIKIEKIISVRNNNLSNFEKLWGAIEEHID